MRNAQGKIRDQSKTTKMEKTMIPVTKSATTFAINCMKPSDSVQRMNRLYLIFRIIANPDGMSLLCNYILNTFCYTFWLRFQAIIDSSSLGHFFKNFLLTRGDTKKLN